MLDLPSPLHYTTLLYTSLKHFTAAASAPTRPWVLWTSRKIKRYILGGASRASANVLPVFAIHMTCSRDRQTQARGQTPCMRQISSSNNKINNNLFVKLLSKLLDVFPIPPLFVVLVCAQLYTYIISTRSSSSGSRIINQSWPTATGAAAAETAASTQAAKDAHGHDHP